VAIRARSLLILGVAFFAALATFTAISASARTKAPPYRLRLIAKGLDGATFLTAVPGNRTVVYVVQRDGRVRALVRGRLSRTVLLDIRGRTSSEGERGLLSVAFHPDYGRNGRLYAYSTARSDGAINIAEYQVRNGRADPKSTRTLLHVPHPDSPFHNGGQLAFGPDGRLYAGIGDGGYLGFGGPGRLQEDPHGNSQNLGVLLAKIFSLDPDSADPAARIAAYGLRNPWRFSFAPRSGDMIIGDVGYNSFEEVDVLKRTARQPVNFGWSVYEGRQRRADARVTLNGAGELLFPLLTYRTSSSENCAITGGYIYRGSVAGLKGRYVFGDYCSGRIWSVLLRDDRAVGLRLEPVRARNLTSFGEDGRGELYAVTLTGRVYKFVRR
jgi:glucose/arabinose dehydrogenase